ncbi:flavodoxin [Secundilactobacillus similis]|uniref:Flavodoxin nitric oxide synthase n=1 Tax=Secundilactobacillus similis DSM 23365 = JCM 2765 TaxID=1423804 RepID=A0A0R2EQ45_9LACO|nr:flavodoxin [Secundilactobacillus similis]KRN18463.1 flavodoxin nitric oxide synthase [Secundilactobacillus similis DSM 23365 = JCM 2765]
MTVARVVFATITGNNEDIADIISEQFEKLGIDVTESEISQTDADDFTDADICVVCPYTYDEGQLPEEGMDFYDDLADINLTGKVYGVAGSGDVFYEDDFCVAVDAFGEALKKAGATQGADNLKIDLEPDESDIEKLDAFTHQLVEKATA